MSCKRTTYFTIFRLEAGCRTGAVLASLALTLVACAGDPPSSAVTMSTRPAPASPEIPPDAIPVAPGLYMQPMGTDERGCPVFQPWSPTLAVVQALHWRTAEGDFTLDREAAACPAGE